MSLNTHRTFPDRERDVILLKNLLKEAEKRIVKEFEKKSVQPLLTKIAVIPDEIDHNYNLDSLHIYISKKTKEIIRTTWPVTENKITIAETFDIRPLIKTMNRSEEYLILLLSQGGAKLYKALNDAVIDEILNNDFPFPKNPHYVTNNEKKSDSKLLDNLVREYFNTIDKAVIKVSQETELPCVIISTEENYNFLMQVSDNHETYIGHAPINYNKTETHHIAQQGWEIIKAWQVLRRSQAINEMKEAISKSLVLTDLREINQAAIDGRGDLLIIYEDFSKSTLMTDEELSIIKTNPSSQNSMDDLINKIAWDVLSKKGRVFFTTKEEIKDLGEIVLKTRY